MTLAITLPGLLGLLLTAPPPDLLTVAESSAYQCSATSAEVSAFVATLAESDPRVRRLEIGRSNEDRPLELLVVADPPVAAPPGPDDERLRILVIGNIHAGEVCGKAASLMLARDLLLADDPRLPEMVLLLVPNYNPDGNDRVAPDNRPGQVGPACGMGERPNAQGLDLNRDWVKLESPEARAMVRLLNEWDPHLTVDTHTTNGSKHRYALTYAAPLNPAGYAPSIAFVRDGMLPRVTERLREQSGYDAFFYGNFDRGHRTWTTYSAQPRFGGPYRGLRGQMSILSEAYAYIGFEDRVRVTYAFLDAILDDATARAADMRILHERARAETAAAGAAPQPDDLVGLRFRVAALPEPVTVLGYELEPDERGRLRPGDEPRDWSVVHRGRFEPVVSVRRPHAYLLEPGLEPVVAQLRRHGIAVEPFTGRARVESYRVDEVSRAERPFQGHRTVQLEVTARDASIDVPAGGHLLRLDQPLGTLAVFLLEPRSEDGLVTWNFFDERLEPGGDFPVHRVRSAADLGR